jgi:hypothetical protein
MISYIKKEILFIGDDDISTNKNKKLNQKPKLLNLIDEYILKFHRNFKRKLKFDINEIIKILKEKYESKKELIMNNINQNIEIDLIFKNNYTGIFLFFNVLLCFNIIFLN